MGVPITAAYVHSRDALAASYTGVPGERLLRLANCATPSPMMVPTTPVVRGGVYGHTYERRGSHDQQQQAACEENSCLRGVNAATGATAMTQHPVACFCSLCPCETDNKTRMLDRGWPSKHR